MAGREEFDVIVVGTGAGGGVMIQELTKAGFRVLALQRGPHLNTADFTDDELKTVIRDEVFSKDQIETYRPDSDSPTMTGRFNQTAECVGGTMTHWAAWSWRFRADSFKVLSTEGAVEGASLADWPYSYEELEPFYEKAELDFGVSGDAKANPFGAPRTSIYPNPPHPPRACSLTFAKGAEKLGYTPFPVPLAINSRMYRGRPSCLYGGTCQSFGCPVHAKATSLSVCIPRALGTGNLTLRPNTAAFEITVGDDGQAKSVKYFDSRKREREAHARHIILAGNAIGSPHLLLMSKSGRFPDGLANGSGLVGKNLTFHIHPAVTMLTDKPSMAVGGMEAHIAVDDFHPSDSKRGFIRGGVIAELNTITRQPLVYTLNASNYPGLERAWGKPFKKFLSTFPRAFSLGSICEDLPMETNTIDLDSEVTDKFGLPAPRITHSQHPNDIAMNKWFTDKLLELADACGATEKWVPELPGVTVSENSAMRGNLHFHGTCRMGEDPSTSVLDKWCRTHEVKNLWVVDGSFFPTSGGYNPTLTILANAYRVADHFIEEAAKRSL